MGQRMKLSTDQQYALFHLRQRGHTFSYLGILFNVTPQGACEAYKRYKNWRHQWSVYEACKGKPPDSVSISDVPFSKRAFKVLLTLDAIYMSEIAGRNVRDFLRVKNCGSRTLLEIEEFLEDFNLSLKWEGKQ